LWQSPPLGFCATSVAIPLPPGWRRSQSALSALGSSLVPRTPLTEGLGYRFCHTAFTAPTRPIMPSSNCAVHLNGCRGNSKPCCREMTRRAAHRASDEQKGDAKGWVSFASPRRPCLFSAAASMHSNDSQSLKQGARRRRAPKASLEVKSFNNFLFILLQRNSFLASVQ
jgi:hypothetical protein